MKTTHDDRPYALLVDRATGGEIEVHPDLFDVLKVTIGNGNKCDAQVTIRIGGGQIMEVGFNAPVKILRQLNEKH